VRLAAAGRAKKYEIGAFFQPAVTGDEGHHLSLADHGYSFELEAFQGLARRQPGFVEMTLDPPAGALGDLVLGQGGQEPGGGPALLVGPVGEVRPDHLDGGQAQIAQGQ
jgi:hypothetical protein